MKKIALTILPVSLALCGCTANDTTLGGALQHNIALQVVNPDPDHGDKEILTSGENAAAAAERYRTGKVKKPVTISTTSGSGGGSSGPN